MEKTRIFLITEQPFYAMMLQQCSFSWNEKVQTAGVRVNEKGVVELAVSKKFFYDLTPPQRVGLLMHEMLHLLMGHLTRGKDLNQHVANVAMDIAINQYIPANYLPPGALLPAQFNLSPGYAFETYYLELLKKAKVMKLPMPSDNHDWQEQGKGEGQGEAQQQQAGQGEKVLSVSSGSLGRDIEQAAIDNIVSKAVQDAKGKFAGNVPAHVEKVLAEKAAASTVSWKAMLRKFIGRNLAKHREDTRTRPNRRQGFFASGSRAVNTPSIIIAVDQSGSVSDALTSKLLDEARTIIDNAGDKVELVYFDTAIAHTEKLDNARKLQQKRWATGGTDFQCVVDYANKKKPDMVIIMTDGEASQPTKSKYPVLWCLPEGYRHDHLTGQKIFVK